MQPTTRAEQKGHLMPKGLGYLLEYGQQNRPESPLLLGSPTLMQWDEIRIRNQTIINNIHIYIYVYKYIYIHQIDLE